MTVQAGDRAELVKVGCKGTVDYADRSYVRVRWDDGRIGLLYFDDNMIPNARYLQRLRAHGENEGKK